MISTLSNFCLARGRARRRVRWLKSGFSLVEVVLALSIMSFGMVSLLGLLAVGLDSFRRSVDSTVMSQISLEVISSARQAKYSELSKLQGVSTYYDDQGASGSGINATNAIYQVRVEVLNPTLIPSSGGALANPGCSTITVTVSRVADLKAFGSSQAWIANNGL